MLLIGSFCIFAKLNKAKTKTCYMRICQRCHLADETVLHALRNRDRIRNAWSLCELADVWLEDGHKGSKTWLTAVAKKLDQSQFELGLYLCWTLWNARNSEGINSEKRNLESIVYAAKKYVEDYTAAQGLIRGTSETEPEKWKAPCYDQIKINFDGATSQPEKCGGCGVVIRDYKGQVLGACSLFQEGIYDPLVTEAIPAVKSLIFAEEIGCRNIVLEGDALHVVSMLNHSEVDTSYIGNLIFEGRTRLGRLGNHTVTDSRRDANLVAHLLAKSAIASKNDLYWIEEVPDFIQTAVDDDCNNL
ncbi:hypothetical protein REPUB_Repub12eG0125000 [Reevesia pubescens]